MTELLEEWLHDLISGEGLSSGLRQLRGWASELDPLEREVVRIAAFSAVYVFLNYTTVTPTPRARRETAKRLVDAALETDD